VARSIVARECRVAGHRKCCGTSGGYLTRDPEMRSLASGKAVTLSVATNEYIGQGKEKAEYQSIVKVYPHAKLRCCAS
jgi:hypothetical protein